MSANINYEDLSYSFEYTPSDFYETLDDLMPEASEEKHPLEDIGKALQIKIYEECAQDPIMFALLCRANNSEGFIKIKTYMKQNEIINSFIVDHYVFILGSRQTGKTTITYIFLLHCLLFNKAYKVGILMQRDGIVKKAIKELYDYYLYLPSWFKAHCTCVVDNALEKRFSNNSSVQGFVVNPANPESAGRSLKVDFLLIDEAAFISYIKETYTALKPATSRRHLKLKKNNLPYGTAIITTPNGMKGTGEWAYEQWIKAVNKETNFRAIRFHWREVPDYDDDWYADTISDMGTREANQEYELKFLGSKTAYLDDEVIEKLQDVDNIKNPLNQIRLKYGKLILFKDLDPDAIYILGADPADTGDDFAAMCLMDYLTEEVVGVYYEQAVGSLEFVEDVYMLMELHPRIILGLEKNALGATSVQLLYKQFGKSRVFVREDKRKSKDAHKECGIITSSVTRKLMMQLVFDYTKNNPENINSAILIYELCSLEKHGARIEAASGQHDDLVMAWTFCLYMINYGALEYYVSYLQVSNDQVKENYALISSLNSNHVLTNDLSMHRVKSPASSESIDSIMNNEYDNPILNLIMNNRQADSSEQDERDSAMNDIFGI